MSAGGVTAVAVREVVAPAVGEAARTGLARSAAPGFTLEPLVGQALSGIPRPSGTCRRA